MTSLPLQIAYRGVDPSDAVEARIYSKVDELEKLFHHLIDYRVVIEQVNRRHHQGKVYNIRVHMGVPGREVTVTNTHPKDQGHENIYDAIADAFQAAEKRLSTYADKLEGRVKTHEPPVHGRVVRLFGDEGYGFIELSDGEEIYFHENAVAHGGFRKLAVDDEVRASIALDDEAEGSHASSIRPIGKHHLSSGS